MMKWFAFRTVWIVGFCLTQSPSIGQAGLAKGDALQNLPIKKVLNSASPLTSSAGFENRLTIIDFFGTWCIPCLRALPHLSKLKEGFKDEIAIVLISNETEAQVTKFIKACNNFSFPVIVDEDNNWNSRFAPPSLPYTVVVKAGKVLAITEAATITEYSVRQWLTQSDATSKLVTKPVKTAGTSPTMNTIQRSKNSLVALSQDYIYAAKTDAATGSLMQDLTNTSYVDLKNRLATDNEKKAFWINLYNGYTQAALKENAGQYESRNAFFGRKSIPAAGELYSLDDIEHGILRRSKIKWSLGHVNKLAASKREKDLRVDQLDYRIHFALNCGAKSCPPIAFYNDETLDAQLDLATKAYLTGEAEYDSTANTIHLPKLMSWFRADFGGKRGMARLLRQFGIIAADAKPKIKFKDYDWTLTLNNYTTQSP